jgi:hypothetical protein
MLNDPLLDRIYEAAAIPELWRGVLGDFARLAGAKEAVLIAQPSLLQDWRRPPGRPRRAVERRADSIPQVAR